MATIDELIAQGNLVRPGGFLGPGNSNIRDGRVRGQGNSGTQRTGTTTATRTPATPQRTMTPVGNSPTDRVNRALAIRQSMGGVQGSRETAETTANAGLSESLRLNLIEQERLRKNAQIPGTVNPVQFRAMQAERDANQAAINSGIEAINAMRTGQLTARGQDVEAETTLADRRMAESGAFDRRLLGLDETMLRGQFGLQEQAMRNEGALAVETAVDPITEARLNRIRALEESFAGADPATRAQLGFSIINNLSSDAGVSMGAPEELVEITDPNDPMSTIQVPQSLANQIGAYTAFRSAPSAFGVTPEMTDRYAEQIATQGWGREQILLAEQTRLAAEQQRAEQQAALKEQRRKRAQTEIQNRLTSGQLAGGL